MSSFTLKLDPGSWSHERLQGRIKRFSGSKTSARILCWNSCRIGCNPYFFLKCWQTIYYYGIENMKRHCSDLTRFKGHRSIKLSGTQRKFVLTQRVAYIESWLPSLPLQSLWKEVANFCPIQRSHLHQRRKLLWNSDGRRSIETRKAWLQQKLGHLCCTQISRFLHIKSILDYYRKHHLPSDGRVSLKKIKEK